MFRAVLGFTFVALLFAGCDSGSPTDNPPTTTPTLTHAAVSLDAVDGFVPFGANALFVRPYYYFAFDDASQIVSVFAATSGDVISVTPGGPLMSSDEYEIRIQTDFDHYIMVYTFVRNPDVGVGDRVAAGERLGRAGVDKNDGRVAFQINREEQGTVPTAYCPEQFGSDAFNAAHDAAFDRAHYPEFPTGPCVRESVAVD